LNWDRNELNEPDGEEFDGLSDGESKNGGNEWVIVKY